MKIKHRKFMGLLLGILLAVLLTVTYWTNCFDRYNPHYGELSSNSEMLVTGAIYHQYRGGGAGSYGLGLSSPANITADALNAGNYLTDAEAGFADGYCTEATVIAVADNETDRANYVVGNTIEFAAGMVCRITEVRAEGIYLFVTYDCEEILTEETGGTLELARVFDAGGNLLTQSVRGNYEAQYGLQGKVLRRLSVLFPVLEMRDMLKLLCAGAMAIVAVLITFLMKKKYGIGMAAAFFAVFLLSPWIVGFASNMYWLESLLFSPMLIGLWCSIGVERRSVRLVSYVGSFGAVFVKSLCGYEYMTVVMLSLIVFLLADFTAALLRKAEKREILLLLRTIFVLGICALLGFFAALLIHARIRGNGDIGQGLLSIYEQDVLRRTLGGDAEQFDAFYADSLNASIGSVLATYFDFTNSTSETRVLSGIGGKLFPVLAAVSCVFTLGRCVKKRRASSVDLLYFWTFVSCISWFILGKSHSAVHTHLNYLMWYFGYVQMVVYALGSALYAVLYYISKKKSECRNDEKSI